MKGSSFYLSMAILIGVWSCSDVKKQEKQKKLSLAYDYLLSPSTQNNIIKKNEKTIDVKGFRNFVFTRSLKEYNDLTPKQEMFSTTDSAESNAKILGVKRDIIDFFEHDYLKKYPLNGTPIFAITLEFLNEELAEISIEVDSDNAKANGIYKENKVMINFLTNAYGNPHLKDIACPGSYECWKWIFPTTIVQYSTTEVNYHLIFTKRDKKELLEQVSEENDKIYEKRKRIEEIEKAEREAEEYREKQRKQIKKEL